MMLEAEEMKYCEGWKGGGGAVITGRGEAPASSGSAPVLDAAGATSLPEKTGKQSRVADDVGRG
jgi:hypothetical protein